ncbi:hypothetical protein [Natronobacterium gregoryi]|uniref:Uncharacterized protein n=1 Tax=Natronobacterium gregoryi (strain ATCC 43098 / DSM 3393 / CCM 3738 / CIP 104747 / IAM 13177 / JCM 8860 / NBRC 102187 / NCIMB 2189 / SP2) TaxID=797304 RepID=L9YIP8_NATGS|nr:hypothetical protein [Natronobacterium gregoryi]ELY73551.1 hypothetical protein C490_01085 [Natronobacterium gregoryi SP2]PLK19421.1 hypothetical protein CYV19_15010 [Natronobacterium gregoryi SP2]
MGGQDRGGRKESSREEDARGGERFESDRDQYDSRRPEGSHGDDTQSGGGLEYRQRGHRAQQGHWTGDSGQETGSNRDEGHRRNQDDDVSNRRHVHDDLPVTDDEEHHES